MTWKPVVTWAFTAKCTPKSGHAWLSVQWMRFYARDVRKDMAENCNVPWEQLRKEGWRVVRVKVTEHLHD